MRIKRKVSISCLGGRLGICLLLAFVPQLLFAQEDSVRFIRDSIQIQPEFNESLFSPFELPSENSAPSSMFHPEHSYSLPDFSLKSLFVCLIRPILPCYFGEITVQAVY